MSQALIVFAKRPEAGVVKTRLTPHLTETEAADLYAAFVADALDKYAEVPADIRLYLAGRGEVTWATPADVQVMDQRGEGLGERMLNAFRDVFDAGYNQAVIVGTDHPTLPVRFIEEAFAALGDPRTVVIGPADDGGYYLLGMSSLRPALFEEMDYSHEEVFEDTLARIGEAPVTVLPGWYDVDRPDELTRLYHDLQAHPNQAPRTFTMLNALAARYAWGLGSTT